MYEINCNLSGQPDSIDYKMFMSAISRVWCVFIEIFGQQLMETIDIFVDNATAGSGHTPITIPVLGKYIIIKLGIVPMSTEGFTAFQFSHELMHCIYYAKYGLDKIPADAEEEYRNNAAYKQGALLAEKIRYNFDELKKLI